MPFIRSSSPKRSNPNDIGIAAISQVYDLWQIDDRWSVRDRRGLMWWAGRHRQHLFVDEGREDHGAVVYKLSAVTELATGVDPDDAQVIERLAVLNWLFGSHALVLDSHARSASLTSSVLFHEHTADWIVPHFAGLAITQVVNAEEHAETFAQLLGAVPNRSRHPRSGTRRHHDEMLGVVEDIYKPHGDEPSRWIGSGEFEQLPRQLHEAGFFFSAGGTYGLIAQTEFGNGSATISATGNDPHHQLGNGLRLSLSLPIVLPENAASGLAVELNAAEAAGFTRSHLLGAWTVKEAPGGYAPEFNSFVPNVLYQRGLLFNLILSLGLKARWAESEIAPYVTKRGRARPAKGGIAGEGRD